MACTEGLAFEATSDRSGGALDCKRLSREVKEGFTSSSGMMASGSSLKDRLEGAGEDREAGVGAVL